jgi:hypothetical protein
VQKITILGDFFPDLVNRSKKSIGSRFFFNHFFNRLIFEKTNLIAVFNRLVFENNDGKIDYYELKQDQKSRLF